MREHSEIVLVLFDANTESLKSYDVATKEWDNLQTYTGDMNKWNFTSVLLNEDIYVFLSNKTVHRLQYSLEGAEWNQIPDMALDHGQYPPAAVLNGCIYVIGSAGSSFESRTCERFNPAENKWEMIEDMLEARRGHAVAAARGQIYCIGGQSAEGELGSVEKFYIDSNIWRHVAPLRTPRHSSAAVELNDKIYVLCGWTLGKRLCDVEMYDPSCDVWSKFQPTTVPRNLLKVCIVGGDLFAVGGDESRHETMERYDRCKQTWEIVTTLDGIKLDAAVAIP